MTLVYCRDVYTSKYCRQGDGEKSRPKIGEKSQNYPFSRDSRHKLRVIRSCLCFMNVLSHLKASVARKEEKKGQESGARLGKK